MRPAPFQYYKATNLEHALDLLAQFGEDGRPLAGGHSLVPMMNLRLARPEHLVDISALPLNAIEVTGSIMRVGALVRHEQYLTDSNVKEHFPAFLEAVHWIGHPTIRRHGTLGGSLSHADPTAELPAISLLYDAVVVSMSKRGERRIQAPDFFAGAFTTDLQPDEMVVAAEFHIPPAASTGTFIELGERRGDFAIASIGVAIEFSHQAIEKAAVVCSGAALKPIRLPQIEDFLLSRLLSDPGAGEAARIVASIIGPVSDHLASADYRKGLIAELLRRAIEQACSKALDKS
jgi:CO/xanthine dehydrogenase FAD-binding subunit